MRTRVERVNSAATNARDRAPGEMPLATIPGFLIRRSQQIHNVIWNDHVAGNLTSPQYAVLASLALRPRIDQHRLGQLASLDKSTVADVVARLAGRMWIARERHPTDGRRYELSVTPAAGLALSHLTPAVTEVQSRLLAPLPDSDRSAFVAQLQLVARLDQTDLMPIVENTNLVLNLDAPGHLIRRAQQVHTATWSSEFGGELTGPQYAALHVLAQWPGINQKTLGEIAALDKSTAADIVLRLQRRGSIVRQKDPTDGRGRVLTLSDAARDEIETLAPRVRAVQESLLEPLPATQRSTFVSALANVAFVGDVPPRAL